jgi:hypothetical protein
VHTRIEQIVERKPTFFQQLGVNAAHMDVDRRVIRPNALTKSHSSTS